MLNLNLLSWLLASIVVLSLFLNQRRKHYPPGPPGLPVIGNAFQIPADRQWLKWHEWQKEYGDVIRITILGEPHIILSSLKAANDLLESRGNIYSDRPTAVMAGELVGWNRGMGYAQATNNPRFRELRRLFHQFMGPRACATEVMLGIQEHENLRLLNKLLDTPAQFLTHIRDSTSSTILLMTYGYPPDNGDPLHLVKIVEDAMAGFARASEPGRWWVDIFPAMKYIPAWFPGASFKRAAAAMKADLDQLCEVPFRFVKGQLDAGRDLPSFISSYLEEKKAGAKPEEEELISSAAAALYSGGAETTPSALTSFILAMALYPDIQTRAQAETNEHLKHQQENDPTNARKLPDFSDRESLPYIAAVILEVWRWNPSVPLGLPHVAAQDDEYRGYHIEKGSTVWVNIWSILHDEESFPDSNEFRPERYLDESSGKLITGPGSLAETVEAAFGFGRRICPGMYLAQNSLYIAVSTILTVFSISKAGDQETGEEIVPEVEYDGFISHSRPFICKITPRSEELVGVVKDRLRNLDLGRVKQGS